MILNWAEYLHTRLTSVIMGLWWRDRDSFFFRDCGMAPIKAILGSSRRGGIFSENRCIVIAYTYKSWGCYNICIQLRHDASIRKVAGRSLIISSRAFIGKLDWTLKERFLCRTSILWCDYIGPAGQDLGPLTVGGLWTLTRPASCNRLVLIFHIKKNFCMWCGLDWVILMGLAQS